MLDPTGPEQLEELLAIFEAEVEEIISAMPWIVTDQPLRQQVVPFLMDMQFYGQRGTMHNWVVRQRATSELIGMIGLDDSTHAIGADWNLGYWVRRSARGRAVATRMIDTVITLARDLDCLGLELKVDPTNEAGVATVQSALRRWGGGRAEEGDRKFQMKDGMVLHNSYLLSLRG